MNLDQTVALITGAARRVGRVIALELAGAGCNVVVHYNRSKDHAESLAEQIRKIPRTCHLVRGDLTEPQSWPRIVQEAVEVMGRLDILINNASVFEPMKLEEFDLEQWDRTFRINLTAVAGLSHHAAPHLRRRGRGRIVNLADISATNPWREHLAYCASKAALVNLTKALAKTLAPDVNVNAIAPGIAEFPEYYEEEFKAKLVHEVPLKRPGTPEEIAKAVRFLCADADYITGQVLNVDGGRSIAR